MFDTELPADPKVFIVKVTIASAEIADTFKVPAVSAALIAAAIFVANWVALLFAFENAIFVAVEVEILLSIAKLTDCPSASCIVKTLVFAAPAVLLRAVIRAVAARPRSVSESL